ncbi:MAG TPA: RNA polymerase sigma factor [Conexibacter sp.]|nr:RNA polymerase sigma factor [Conexibacter sp.]
MNEIALAGRAAPALALGERLLSDERLAQRVARGSERAFAVLCERHGAALHRYCRSIVRDEHDAEDALQSALMRAFAALRASEREVAVRPWLFRIVHNEAISLMRRRRATPSPLDAHAPASGSVAATVEGRERLATLVADIQTLSERQRAALVMRELSGLSIEEIAAALATTPGAAKQALFEARGALHELAEGRAMDCEGVRRTISERDGRVLRGRKLRAHVHACPGCRDFAALIETRTADLRALVPPLPSAAIGGLLARVLAHSAGSGSGGGTGLGVSLGGQAAGASIAGKAAAGLAIGVVALGGTARVATRAHGFRPAHRAVERAAHATAHSGRPGQRAVGRVVSVEAAARPSPVRRSGRGVSSDAGAAGGAPAAAGHVQARGEPAPDGMLDEAPAREHGAAASAPAPGARHAAKASPPKHSRAAHPLHPAVPPKPPRPHAPSHASEHGASPRAPSAADRPPRADAPPPHADPGGHPSTPRR